MSAEPPVSREQVVAVVAEYANQPPELVGEQIDSMGVAWLVDVAERRWGIPLDVSDELLADMSTVTGAVKAIQSAAQDRVAQDRAGDG